MMRTSGFLCASYLVYSVYQFITSQELHHHFTLVLDSIWHKDIPLKRSLFAWCLLCNRMPNEGILFRWGIITRDSQLFVSGCGNIESTNLFFFAWNVFSSLWHLVHNWFGISSIDPFGITYHFLQFGRSTGASKARQSKMDLIWFSCAWVIWNEWNNKIFTNNTCSTIDFWMKLSCFPFCGWRKNMLILFLVIIVGCFVLLFVWDRLIFSFCDFCRLPLFGSLLLLNIWVLLWYVMCCGEWCFNVSIFYFG